MKQSRTALAALSLALLALTALAAPVTYPGPAYTDDSGVKVTPSSVTVTSITTKSGAAITGATVTPNIAGSNSSVDYDAAAYGEAWVTLAPTLTGHTFVNNPPVIFCSADPQSLATNTALTTSTNKALVLGSGTVSSATAPTPSAFSASLSGLTDPSFDELTWLPGSANAGKASHVVSYAGGVLTLAAPLPSTPITGDTFSLSPYGKGLVQLTTNLGTDGKVQISATDTQVAAEILSSPGNKILTNSLGQIDIDLSQAVSSTFTGQTVGGGLLGGWASIFSKQVVTGTVGTAGSSFTTYAADGTTTLKAFSLATSGTRQ